MARRCYWRQRGASWPRVRGTGGEHRANLCCRLQSGDAVEAQRFGGKRPDRKEETPMAEPKDSKQFPTEIGDAFIEERFWAVRGRAIQAYAKLEQALCLIFATLCDMPPDVAGIIFFRIVNAGTLHSILERLMKKKHGTTYSSFWGSFLDAIRGTSQRRNEIVHWSAMMFVDGSDRLLALTPANIYDFGHNTPAPITVTVMVDFTAKCMFLARLGHRLHDILTPNVAAELDPAEVQTWRGIFAQPVIYPPPDSHPLFQTPPAPGSPPPPSPP